jgi:hypothetical protein
VLSCTVLSPFKAIQYNVQFSLSSPLHSNMVSGQPPSSSIRHAALSPRRQFVMMRCQGRQVKPQTHYVDRVAAAAESSVPIFFPSVAVAASPSSPCLAVPSVTFLVGAGSTTIFSARRGAVCRPPASLEPPVVLPSVADPAVPASSAAVFILAVGAACRCRRLPSTRPVAAVLPSRIRLLEVAAIFPARPLVADCLRGRAQSSRPCLRRRRGTVPASLPPSRHCIRCHRGPISVAPPRSCSSRRWLSVCSSRTTACPPLPPDCTHFYLQFCICLDHLRLLCCNPFSPCCADSNLVSFCWLLLSAGLISR